MRTISGLVLLGAGLAAPAAAAARAALADPVEQRDTAGVLLKLGADPLLPNLDGTTPLMAAAGVAPTNRRRRRARKAKRWKR